MRQVEVDIDVYAMIWASRKPSEMNENDILKRILREASFVDTLAASPVDLPDSVTAFQHISTPVEELPRSKDVKDLEVSMSLAFGKTRWVDDVCLALRRLGGGAALHEIYKQVEEIRRSGGRSVPKSLEATVRRTIEDHSSDSDNFRGADIFRKLGRGQWGLRKG